MDGTYNGGLPTAANARSVLTFTKEALEEGRRKAIAIWNEFPTDATNSPQISTSNTTNSMVEDAAFAFAVLNESARIDSQRATMQGAGIVGDPAANLSQMTSAALQTVREYGKWVADTKPLMAATSLGI